MSLENGENSDHLLGIAVSQKVFGLGVSSLAGKSELLQGELGISYLLIFMVSWQ